MPTVDYVPREQAQVKAVIAAKEVRALVASLISSCAQASALEGEAGAFFWNLRDYADGLEPQINAELARIGIVREDA